MKRTQVDIFGLAIFVALIFIAFIGFIIFSSSEVKTDESSGLTRYFDNQLADEIIGLMTETTLNNSNVMIIDGFKAYLRGETLGGDYSGNLELELKNAINVIVNGTLKANGFDYYFFASNLNISSLCSSSFGSECNSTAITDPDINFIESGDNDICFCSMKYSGKPGVHQFLLSADNPELGNGNIFLSIEPVSNS